MGRLPNRAPAKAADFDPLDPLDREMVVLWAGHVAMTAGPGDVIDYLGALPSPLRWPLGHERREALTSLRRAAVDALPDAARAAVDREAAARALLERLDTMRQLGWTPDQITELLDHEARIARHRGSPGPGPGIQANTGPGRIAFSTAGAAMRATLLAANSARLTARQMRTLTAVLAYTATYSRLTDRVWLDQIAAFSYGVTESKPWMRGKVREDLVALEAAGLIIRQAPKGRPPSGASGPSYTIGILPAPEKVTPDSGSLTEESHPEPGATSGEESHPDPVGKSPRDRLESHPDPGPPTEKGYEEIPEEREGGAHIERSAGPVETNGHHPPPTDPISIITTKYKQRLHPRGRRHSEEIDADVAMLRATLGDHALHAALDNFPGSVIVDYSRELKDRILAMLQPVAATGPHPAPTRPRCTNPDCDGRGHLRDLDVDDAGRLVAKPCPDCNSYTQPTW